MHSILNENRTRRDLLKTLVHRSAVGFCNSSHFPRVNDPEKNKQQPNRKKGWQLNRWHRGKDLRCKRSILEQIQDHLEGGLKRRNQKEKDLAKEEGLRLSAKNKTVVDQLEMEEQSKPESLEEKPSGWLNDSEGEGGWIYKLPQIYSAQFSKSKRNHLCSANRTMSSKRNCFANEIYKGTVYTGRRG